MGNNLDKEIQPSQSDMISWLPPLIRNLHFRNQEMSTKSAQKIWKIISKDILGWNFLQNFSRIKAHRQTEIEENARGVVAK